MVLLRSNIPGWSAFSSARCRALLSTRLTTASIREFERARSPESAAPCAADRAVDRFSATPIRRLRGLRCAGFLCSSDSAYGACAARMHAPDREAQMCGARAVPRAAVLSVATRLVGSAAHGSTSNLLTLTQRILESFLEAPIRLPTFLTDPRRPDRQGPRQQSAVR